MTHVVTLIAAKIGALDEKMAEHARSILPRGQRPQWLSPGTAADILFSADDTSNQRALAEHVRGALAETFKTTVDVVTQRSALRRKRLFLADMDSTMIGQECIDELADYVGLKAQVAALTERAMRGEMAFEPALRERVGMLAGLPASVIDEVIEQRIRPNPGARTLIATLRANRVHTCLVSGGFTLFTDRVAAMIGFDETRANKLLLADGKLTGTVQEPIFARDGKRAALAELRTQFNLRQEETLAIGDGANDMDMIADAGLGVAYHAKPKVAQAAPARIDHADLTALLYVQGYKRGEFVQA